MKIILNVMTLISFFIISDSLRAQQSQEVIAKIQKEAKLIQTELDLDEKQAFEIENLMLKAIERVKGISEELIDDAKDVKNKIFSIQEERDKELEACLSEEQWIIFNILRKKMNDHRPKRQKAMNHAHKTINLKARS